MTHLYRKIIVEWTHLSWCWHSPLWRTTPSPSSLWLCRCCSQGGQPQSSMAVPEYAHSCYRIHLCCSNSHDYISPCVLSGLHHCSMELHHLRLLCPAKTVQQNVVCVWGDHKAVKGDVTGSAQCCLLEGQGHSPGLDGVSGLEQIPAPRWANTKTRSISQP